MNKLVDSFGRKHTYLRISVTDRCNLRCLYCMPHEGMEFQPKKELLSFEEIFRLSRIFVSLGITKIRLTGGEPMVRKNLPVLVELLAGLDGLQNLAMTTNATLLQAHAKQLRQAGLSSLNISLDTLHADRFLQITRRDDHANVLAGIEAAKAAGFSKLKLNVVVMSGINDDEVLDFVDFVKDTQINVRFIEYMPFKSNGWQLEKVVTYQDMKERIEKVYRLIPIDTEPSAVAKDFSIEGHSGSVSFISSMSDSFCSTCNRLRLTATGSIKSCLFYPAEMSLKEALRSGATDGEVTQMIMEALAMKPEAHPPAEEILAEDNRAMIEIGG